MAISLKQRIFNRVSAHLMKQKAKSMDGMSCRYRSADGKRCAIGCLITDKHYSRTFEGCSPHDNDVSHGIEKSLNAPGKITKDLVCIDFLDSLQRVHDWAEVENWKERLIAFAEANELKPPNCLK